MMWTIVYTTKQKLELFSVCAISVSVDLPLIFSKGHTLIANGSLSQKQNMTKYVCNILIAVSLGVRL